MVKASVIVMVMLIIIKIVYGIRDKQMTSNVTQTLDFLLASNRYDKRLRPNFGGSPITVSVNFFIKSMGPVSDNDQSYGLDCYFRQHWYDLRLRYQKLPGLEEFSMSWLFLDRVWKPDTYFVNGKRSYLHRITVPNKFLRLRHDGYITYSMRLTISASCPMYLRKFPLDAQRCPLILGSYGYTNKDLIYKWTDSSPIGLQEGVEIAQFDLVNITTENEKTLVRGGLSFSTVQANFWLKRHTGYFMLQVYIPCGLIVLCSWISFWIDPDAVPARVTLGVTTVLSLTTMGFGGRSQLPKVSYWTALDWFVIICFTSVFSVMIEYAIVNFVDKFTKDFKKMIQNRKKEEEEAHKLELKDDEVEVKQKSDTLNLDVSKERKRSASFSFTTSNAKEKESQKEFAEVPSIEATSTRLDVLRNLPSFSRKLSTTVISYVKSPLLSKRSRSIPNIHSAEIEKEKSTQPKIIVTDFDENLIDLDRDLVNPIETVLEVERERVGSICEDDAEEKNRIFQNFLESLKCHKDFWERFSVLPRKADIISLMESTESPSKFSRIDVQSRRNFPIAFFISLIIYLFAFTYYLTDDFPARNTDVLLYKQ